MPNLLSRSKHEEFKLNSPLQIKDQKERRAKIEENGALRNLVLAALFPAPALFLLLLVPAFYAMPCLLLLLVFFPFYPCNSLPILVFL